MNTTVRVLPGFALAFALAACAHGHSSAPPPADPCAASAEPCVSHVPNPDVAIP